MTPRLLSPLVCLLALPLMAQVQNGLDFDGIDDRVDVPNASAFIANATGISMSCWVYPRNTAPAFPDFDGIIGFRNEFDCDFYMLQLEPHTIEARFRNSDGLAYTVTGTGLQLNTWQLIVLTYDGSTLSLWINGALSASGPASGLITSTTTPLYIGDLTFQFYDFWLNGKVDEAALWKRALTAAEINCLVETPPNPGDPDAVLYFNCDQGTAGGDNTAITSLTDLTGHGDGSFENMALTGGTSNFVQGTSFGTSMTASICPGGTYTFNGEELTQPGTYTASFVTGGACDSVVNLTLVEAQVGTSVLQSGNTLICTNGGALYQWLDCGNGYAPVPNAYNASFTPSSPGSYAVQVTDNGCTDTSACYQVGTIGIPELSALQQAVVGPTLAGDQLTILLPAPLPGLRAEVLSAEGRMLRVDDLSSSDRSTVDLRGLPAGAYLLRLRGREGVVVRRFAKE